MRAPSGGLQAWLHPGTVVLSLCNSMQPVIPTPTVSPRGIHSLWATFKEVQGGALRSVTPLSLLPTILYSQKGLSPAHLTSREGLTQSPLSALGGTSTKHPHPVAPTPNGRPYSRCNDVPVCGLSRQFRCRSGALLSWGLSAISRGPGRWK